MSTAAIELLLSVLGLRYDDTCDCDNCEAVADFVDDPDHHVWTGTSRSGDDFVAVTVEERECPEDD